MHVGEKLCCKVFAPAPDSGDVGKENICEIRGVQNFSANGLPKRLIM